MALATHGEFRDEIAAQETVANQIALDLEGCEDEKDAAELRQALVRAQRRLEQMAADQRRRTQ